MASVELQPDLSPSRETLRSPGQLKCKPRVRDAVGPYLWIFPFVGTLVILFAYDYCLEIRGPETHCGLYTVPVLAIAFTLYCALCFVFKNIGGCTTADTANRTAYAHLHARATELYSKLQTYDASSEPINQQPYDASPEAINQQPLQRLAYRQARQLYNAALTRLEDGGPQWLAGYGYLSVLVILHRAEEALFECEDETSVIGDAWYDYRRISGSTIDEPTKQVLRRQIQIAIYAISQNAFKRYWPDLGIPALEIKEHDADARAMLRVVRRTLNELRDGIRLQLNYVRIKALAACAFIGCMVFLLAAASIAWHSHFRPDSAPRPFDYATSVFVFGPLVCFLVGASAGLLYRLYSDSSTGLAKDAKVAESGNLTELPPVLAPLISGLAAIGGAVVTGGLLTAGGDAGSQSAAVLKLFAARDVANLILASIVFGVAPGLLFDRLAQYTGSLKRDLQSTSAAPSTGVATYDASALERVATQAVVQVVPKMPAANETANGTTSPGNVGVR
jgi:hypothetical protein